MYGVISLPKIAEVIRTSLKTLHNDDMTPTISVLAFTHYYAILWLYMPTAPSSVSSSSVCPSKLFYMGIVGTKLNFG